MLGWIILGGIIILAAGVLYCWNNPERCGGHRIIGLPDGTIAEV